MLMTKDEFKQRIMNLGLFTSEQFDNLFEIVPCNCIGFGCAGWDLSRKAKFVVLEGLQYGNRFFSSYTPGSDPTKSAKGETWYKIIGYANTIEEAQKMI